MNSIWGKNVACFHCKVERQRKYYFHCTQKDLSTLEQLGDQILKRTGCWCSVTGRIQKNPENNGIPFQSEVRIRNVLSVDMILKPRTRSTLLFMLSAFLSPQNSSVSLYCIFPGRKIPSKPKLILFFFLKAQRRYWSTKGAGLPLRALWSGRKLLQRLQSEKFSVNCCATCRTSQVKAPIYYQ